MHRAARPGAAPRPPGLTRLAACALAASLGLAAAGCGQPSAPAGPPPAAAPPGTADPAGPTTPAATVPPGMPPETYRQAVAAGAGEIRAGLDAVAAAEGYAELLRTLQAATATLAAVAERLAGLDPPAELVEAHAEMVASLGEYGIELAGLAEATAGMEVCAAPAAMARMAGFDAAQRVLAAAAGLDGAAAGRRHEVERLLPAAMPEQDRSLPSGSFVTDRRPEGGRGRLHLDNRSTGRDVVVTVTRSDRVLVAVYVADEARRTVTGIPDGTYEVFYTSGEDWDEGLGSFTRDCAFARFDESISLRSDERTSTIVTITLRPVSGGNVTRSRVDPGTFPG